MKQLFLIFLIIESVLGAAQSQDRFLGQTKAYIIKQNETCEIYKNTDEELMINCNGAVNIFKFSGEYTLCTELTIFLSDDKRNDLIRTILTQGGKKTDAGKYSQLPIESYELQDLLYAISSRAESSPEKGLLVYAILISKKK